MLTVAGLQWCKGGTYIASSIRIFIARVAPEATTFSKVVTALIHTEMSVDICAA